MALMYEFPGEEYIDPKSIDLSRLPVLDKPVRVPYSSDKDLFGLLEAVDSSSACSVCGPVGVGKSSRIPSAVAVHTERLVMVVTSNPMLAYLAYEAFKDSRVCGSSGRPLRPGLMTDNSFDVHAYDIVWVGASRFVSWLISRALRSSLDGLLEDMVVVLDEAQEMEAYTHVVASVVPHCGVYSYISIENVVLEQQHIEPGSSLQGVRICSFERSDSRDWDVCQAGEPWFFGSIKKGAVIYEDQDDAAMALVRQYKAVNYEAFRLNSRSKFSQLAAALRMMHSDKTPPVVLVVDSSYRHGFHFPADVVIDTGLRYELDPETGVHSYYKRDLTWNEVAGTSCRAAHEGTQARYYCPLIDYQHKPVKLSAVDREAAAMLIRCMGLFPNRETAATVMAYDNLPVGVNPVLALNGPTPLSCYVRDKYGARKVGTRAVSIEPLQPKPISCVVSGKVSGSSQARDARDRRASVETVISALSESAGLQACAVSRVAGTGRPSTVCASRVIQATEKRPKEKGAVGSRVSFKDTTTILPNDSISRFETGPAPKVAEAVGGRVFLSSRDAGSGNSRTASIMPSSTAISVQSSVDEVWEGIVRAMDSQGEVQVRCGAYLYCDDVNAADVAESSRHFPKAEVTVEEMVVGRQLKRLASQLGSKHIKFALYHTLRKYNMLNLNVNAMKRAVTQASATFGEGFHGSGRFSKVLKGIVGRVAELEGQRSVQYEAVTTLADVKGYSVLPLGGVGNAEDDLARGYTEKIAKQLSTGDGGAVNVDMATWLGVAQKGVSSAAAVRKVSSSSSARRRCSVKVVYVKPMIGVSSLTINPDKTVDIRPGRLLQKLTGVSRFGLLDLDVVPGGRLS